MTTRDDDSGYFFTGPEAEADPDDPPRFLRVPDDVLGLHPAGPGLTLRPVFGRNLTMSFVAMEPHSEAPVHQHAEEQMGTIIEGSYEFELAGEKRVVRKGDVYVVPPWVPHGAVTHDEPVLALDVFSPPRAGFRELMEQALRERDEATGGARGPGEPGQSP